MDIDWANVPGREVIARAELTTSKGQDVCHPAPVLYLFLWLMRIDRRG